MVTSEVYEVVEGNLELNRATDKPGKIHTIEVIIKAVRVSCSVSIVVMDSL
jgi:hypothetical protein